LLISGANRPAERDIGGGAVARSARQ